MNEYNSLICKDKKFENFFFLLHKKTPFVTRVSKRRIVGKKNARCHPGEKAIEENFQKRALLAYAIVELRLLAASNNVRSSKS